jgi:lipoprotein-anchoring transpeptidase ErfK/SrfK
MRWLGAVAAVLAMAGIGLVLGGALGAGDGRGGGPGTGPRLPGPVGGATGFSAADAVAAPDDDVAVVARARGSAVAIYRRPGDREPARQLVERTIDGQRLPMVFLVEDRRPGWVRVHLPVRPNQARGWVRAGAVRLARTGYHVVIGLRRHRLTVYDRERVVLRTRTAVGRSVSPTPTGRYFITDLLRPPDPGGFYGPYAFGLSAYSPVYTSFAGGDGQVGIHGTNQPAVIGTDVSHGCIRVANRVIERLAKRLPLGTPVTIRR